LLEAYAHWLWALQINYGSYHYILSRTQSAVFLYVLISTRCSYFNYIQSCSCIIKTYIMFPSLRFIETPKGCSCRLGVAWGSECSCRDSQRELCGVQITPFDHFFLLNNRLIAIYFTLLFYLSRFFQSPSTTMQLVLRHWWITTHSCFPATTMIMGNGNFWNFANFEFNFLSLLAVTPSIPNYRSFWHFYVHSFCYAPRCTLCIDT